jgi:HK97 family phage major capsid protein
MPTLVEQRNNLLEEMEGLLGKTKSETRSFTDEESNRFDEIKKEIAKIDKTLAAEEESRSFEKKDVKKVNGEEEQRVLEEDKFLRFIKGEQRALDVATNGGVIPTHIANKIIEKVKELSPIYSMATVYNVGGDLVFPVYDEETSSIGAAYVDDLTELTEGTGKFTTVKLENFIVGVLAKVSKSLMNRTDFDLVSFVINKVAKAIAEFLERELIKGTAGKMEGLSSTTNVVISASSTAVTADELIDVQMTVPEVYQANAVWITNKSTLKALRKLKDADGNYLLGTALNGFGFTLLGKPVHISESVDAIGVSNKVLYYGDMSGLHIKLAQNVEIQVLMEKYATQHAIGVVGYVEADSAIVETQKIAALQMAAV